jgi:hypothetical protein
MLLILQRNKIFIGIELKAIKMNFLQFPRYGRRVFGKEISLVCCARESHN